MDKHLNSDQERLFDLISSKEFSELNDSEKSFVLLHMTEKEYVMQYKIMNDSDEVYDVSTVAVPAFMGRGQAKGSIWFKKIPAYQTILAVAATVLIMWFANSDKVLFDIEIKESSEVAKADTVYQDVFHTDTVIMEVEKPVVVEKVKTIVKKEIVYMSPEEKSSDNVFSEVDRVLVPPKINYPTIADQLEKSTASTFANDETSVLIEGLSLNN